MLNSLYKLYENGWIKTVIFIKYDVKSWGLRVKQLPQSSIRKERRMMWHIRLFACYDKPLIL